MKTKYDIGQTVYYVGYDDAFRVKITSINIEEGGTIRYRGKENSSYNENELYETFEAARFVVIEKKLKSAKKKEKEIQKEISELEEQKKQVMILALGEIK